MERVMSVLTSESVTTANLETEIGLFIGVANYHEGDVKDCDLAVKIAKAKAWRNYWTAKEKEEVANYKNLTKAVNEAADNIVYSHKRVSDLNDYILKLCHKNK